MSKLTWATDIHLDFLEKPGEPGGAHDFVIPFSKTKCDGFVLSGDLSTAENLEYHLRLFDRYVRSPVYFVLGNHDFYGGSIKDVRQMVSRVCSSSKNLRYLTEGGVISLSRKTAIVGHDGWYDASHGDVLRSPYIMSDWFKISEFLNAGVSSVGMYGPTVNKAVAVSVARKLAAEAAEYVEHHASLAAKDHEVVVVVTHVPPFPEAHKHEGKGGSDVAMPWYTSKLMGDALKKVASQNPQTKFEVFCGHTHGACDAQIESNLSCHVGHSEYGMPEICGEIRVP